MSCINLSFESLPREELSMNQDYECSNDIYDRIKVMRQQEKRYQSGDYLNQSNGATVINAECRSRMVEWCYQTIDFFKLSRETVKVAVSCLDRFLSTQQGRPYLMDTRMFQLACITCLYVAIKVHEPVELHVSLLVQLCKGAYSEEQIFHAENLILTTLGWAVNPPSAKAFVQLFLALLPPSVSVETRRDMLDLACYQIEMAVADYNLDVLMQPSAVAVASMLNALSLCPEIATHSASIFLRNLGKSTGCSRHLHGVSFAKDIMLAFLNKTNEANPAQQKPSQKRRRQSCCVREQHLHARLSGQPSSPVAVMER